MAISLSKLFMRTISQNPNENQTGISLWTIEDIEKAQANQRAQTLGDRGGDEDVEDDEYGDGGIDDEMLVDVDLGLWTSSPAVAMI